MEHGEHHPAVDGQCPRCGAFVSETSRFCRECLLQLVPGEGLGAGQTNLLRAAWERDHPEHAAAFEAWAASREGPPPGVTNPYTPPKHERTLGEWKPLDGRLRLVKAVFAAVIVLALLNAGSNAMEINLLEDVRSGGSVTNTEIDGNDRRVVLLARVQLAVLVAAAIVFILWFHRAYQNVGALRTGERREHPTWAIASWFVPILNLFRPKQIANDLWASGTPEGEDRSPPVVLFLWWTLWLVGGFLGRIARRAFNDDSAESLIRGDKFAIASNLISVAAAALAIVAATLITRRLQARHAEQQEQEQAGLGPVSPQAPGAALPA